MPLKCRPTRAKSGDDAAREQEAEIGDAVLDELKTDVAVIQKREFDPSRERTTGFGRGLQMHFQPHQGAIATIVEATESPFSGRLDKMTTANCLAAIAAQRPPCTVGCNGPDRYISS